MFLENERAQTTLTLDLHSLFQWLAWELPQAFYRIMAAYRHLPLRSGNAGMPVIGDVKKIQPDSAMPSSTRLCVLMTR